MASSNFYGHQQPIVFLVDDDKSLLSTLSLAVKQGGFEVKTFSSARDFLDNFNDEHGCLVLDLSMPGMDGFELQSELAKLQHGIPIVFMTGHGGVPDSVKAMRGGAIDFLEKPFRTAQLMERIEEAIQLDAERKVLIQETQDIRRRIAKLTGRERDIYDLLIATGEPPTSKSIARTLNISHRTVEHHRSRILEKLEVSSVVELRLTVAKV